MKTFFASFKLKQLLIPLFILKFLVFSIWNFLFHLQVMFLLRAFIIFVGVYNLLKLIISKMYFKITD